MHMNPYQKYKTDYSNQVHMLNISICKNLFLLKNNTIKRQEKKFDINWKNYHKTEKTHLVSFVITDHFSSCFYAELHSIESIPKIYEFLYNAWKMKETYRFCGIPETLIVPNITIEMFPEILNFPKHYEDINLQLPTSGFDAGIRHKKTWEEFIRINTYDEDEYKYLNIFQLNNEKICKSCNYNQWEKNCKYNKWLSGKPKLIVPDSFENFKKYFS